jgi:hypothetical protein
MDSSDQTMITTEEELSAADSPVGSSLLTADQLAIILSDSAEESRWSRYSGSTSKGCC